MKKLVPLVLSGALMFSGCANTDYYYDGMIGQDHVEFGELVPIPGFDFGHTMNVEKPDGIEIIYSGNQVGTKYKVSKVVITNPDGSSNKYSLKNWKSTPVGDTVLDEAQRQFDSYMSQIIEINSQKALANLN